LIDGEWNEEIGVRNERTGERGENYELYLVDVLQVEVERMEFRG
jgi:hypothetical protein